MTAQRSDLDAADVDTVDEDFALLNVVIAAKQGKDGRFTGTGGADEGDGFACFDLERNVLEDPLIGVIRKSRLPTFWVSAKTHIPSMKLVF